MYFAATDSSMNGYGIYVFEGVKIKIIDTDDGVAEEYLFRDYLAFPESVKSQIQGVVMDDGFFDTYAVSATNFTEALKGRLRCKGVDVLWDNESVLHFERMADIKDTLIAIAGDGGCACRITVSKTLFLELNAMSFLYIEKIGGVYRVVIELKVTSNCTAELRLGVYCFFSDNGFIGIEKIDPFNVPCRCDITEAYMLPQSLIARLSLM